MDRRKALLDLLLDRGRLAVDEMARHFGVTGMTIRRDLAALEAAGLLTRTHGGCALRTPQVRELPFQEKEQQHRDAKEAIARAVVAALPDGISLYLDTGTTCALIAHLLPIHRRGLRIVTNNLPAALALFGGTDFAITVPGGQLGAQSPDLTGDFAIERLRLLRLDVAILGADAVDAASAEFYAADLPTATLARTAQRQTRQTFLCVDSSKLDKRAMALAGNLGDGTTVVTDANATPAQRRAIRGAGAKLVVAQHPSSRPPQPKEDRHDRNL